MSIKCGNCKGTHDSVSAVRDCYERSEQQRTAEPASLKQLNLAQQLFRERETPSSLLDWLVLGNANASQLDYEQAINKLSKEQASKFISEMLQQPARPSVPQKVEAPVPGIYWNPKSQQVFKVYLTQSSRLAAKSLLESEEGKWSWVYLGIAQRKLDFGTIELMPIEEAKRFGQVNGICVRCGALLTDEKSIAEGIGPICAGKGMTF